ncbi:hypothetical protein [Luteimonas abyssi]|uniref:hypothetical protein n=1 Tax=Luteimonas abyssi TaxID=1247514 RepID=UPI000737D0D3|nr:hypothetical protein [Luteimonas abyssi]
MGLLIGLLLAMAGAGMLFKPSAMTVHHSGGPKSRSTQEQVSIPRARAYAGGLLALGIAVVAISVVRLDR